MSRTTPKTLRVTDPAARAALASPTRLEILGQFLDEEGTSVADLAERMGRKPSSLYYHVRHLESVGLLVEKGLRRKGKRDEVLYAPVADGFELDDSHPDEARKTLSIAFRMAERDLAAAIEDPSSVCEEGEARNARAYRLHARLTPRALARINHHLDAIEAILQREGSRKRIPPDADR